MALPLIPARGIALGPIGVSKEGTEHCRTLRNAAILEKKC